VVLLGYNSVGGLDFFNTVAGTATHVTGDGRNVADIATDGSGHFYVLTVSPGEAHLYTFDLTGAPLNSAVLSNRNAPSVCYDPLSANLLVGYSAGAFDLELRSGNDLSSIQTGPSPAPNGLVVVRPTGDGGFWLGGVNTVGGHTGLHFVQASSINPY